MSKPNYTTSAISDRGYWDIITPAFNYQLTDTRAVYGPDNWVDCIRAEYGDDAQEFGFGRSVWVVFVDDNAGAYWQRLEA